MLTSCYWVLDRLCVIFAINSAEDHLFSEFFEVPVLSLVIIGMYQGIEINHPIYALIFCDLVVCFIFTGKLIIFLDKFSEKI